MAANISWVSTELNFLRSISKEIALGGLDRAIEAGFVEIVGYTTGDSTRNRQVDAITTNLFGIQIERCSKSRGCSCR